MNNERYIRQISLPKVGIAGQRKLAEASVLIVGIGGLGNALLPYLVSSGIGRIGLVDGDNVSLSNLHRQALFSDQDIGLLKVEVAKRKLQTMNPTVVIDSIPAYLSSENALALFQQYDIIVDATDRVPVRYLINDAAVLTNKPFVHAALYRFQIQISVFNFQSGPTYRCLYPTAPKKIPSCDEAGVLPTTVGMAGLLQANEVMKIILGIGDVLSGKLLLFDALTTQQHEFSFAKNSELKITEAFFLQEHQPETIPTISYAEAQQKGGWFVDVREAHELPKLSMENYIQFPMSKFEHEPFPLESTQHIFLFCQAGARSADAYRILKKQQYQTIYCLQENAPQLSKHLTHEKEKNRIH